MSKKLANTVFIYLALNFTVMIFAPVVYGAADVAEAAARERNDDVLSLTSDALKNKNDYSELIMKYNNLKKGVDDLANMVRSNQEQLDEIALAVKEKNTNKQKSIYANSENEITYNVWISILLASVAVIVTTLGVAIAILAYIGYKTTIKKAEEIAAESAANKAQEITANIARTEITQRINDGSFNELIEDAVDKVVYKGIGSFPGSETESED